MQERVLPEEGNKKSATRDSGLATGDNPHPASSMSRLQRLVYRLPPSLRRGLRRLPGADRARAIIAGRPGESAAASGTLRPVAKEHSEPFACKCKLGSDEPL